MKLGFILAFIILTLAPSAFAQTAASQVKDKAVFAFGGRMVNDNFEYSFLPFIVPYEDNYILGAGYQQFFFEPIEDWKVGLEIGAAARFGEVFSGEFWGGTVVRYDGLVLGDTLRISPSLTFGLSAITRSIGVEAKREIWYNGDATLLFYLSPEISFARAEDPDNEIFYRLQHRSGAWGTIGGLADGHNGHVVGLRHHF